MVIQIMPTFDKNLNKIEIHLELGRRLCTGFNFPTLTFIVHYMTINHLGKNTLVHSSSKAIICDFKPDMTVP